MKRLIVVLAATLVALLSTAGPAGAATQYLWQQDFSQDTTDWQGPVTHNSGDGTATVGEGAYSRFGEYRSQWPGDYVAQLDVYLDPTWSTGTGFEYTVAATGSDGEHLRDFVFHVAKTATGGLRVNADNNSHGSSGNAYVAGQTGSAEITEAGWYTMKHTFRDDNGVLAVDLTLLDSDGQVVFTETLSNPEDTMDQVGGNRYAWFASNNVPGGVEIDNQELYPAQDVTKDDCKMGGYASYGFKNQGQCVSSVQANPNANK